MRAYAEITTAFLESPHTAHWAGAQARHLCFYIITP